MLDHFRIECFAGRRLPLKDTHQSVVSIQFGPAARYVLVASAEWFLGGGGVVAAPGSLLVCLTPEPISEGTFVLEPCTTVHRLTRAIKALLERPKHHLIINRGCQGNTFVSRRLQVGPSQVLVALVDPFCDRVELSIFRHFLTG